MGSQLTLKKSEGLTSSRQHGTFLDFSYGTFPGLPALSPDSTPSLSLGPVVVTDRGQRDLVDSVRRSTMAVGSVGSGGRWGFSVGFRVWSGNMGVCSEPSVHAVSGLMRGVKCGQGA